MSVSENQTQTDEPLDDRLRFFLEQQKQIQEWAALAVEVQEAVDGLLRDLRVDLTADPRVGDLDIRVGTHVNSETATGPVLYRPAWCFDAEGVPDVGIAMGWDGKVDPAGLSLRTTMPYVGVVTAHQTNPGRSIEARLRAGSAARLNETPKYKVGSHWVVFRLLTPNRDWWRDVPTWRKGLVDELLAAGTRWAGLVDEAVSGEVTSSAR